MRMLIRERLENFDFSNSEQKIVTYILEKKAAIEEMTTKEIAEATYTSPSTLVRIAHKMNFSGWSDLKEAFLKEEEYLQKNFSEINANLPFHRNDTIMSIASKIAALEKESIDDTLSLITHDDLQKAIQIIRKSSYTSLFAVSNNLLITQEFQHNMSRIKKTSGNLLVAGRNDLQGAPGGSFLLRNHRLLFRRNFDIERNNPIFKSEQYPHHRHHQYRGQYDRPACGLRAQNLHKGEALFKNRHLLHRQRHRVPAGRTLFLHLCTRLRCQPATADQHFQDD